MGEIFESQGHEVETIEQREARRQREASRSAAIARDVVGKTVRVAKDVAMKGVERVVPGLAQVIRGVEKTGHQLALETGENMQVTKAFRDGMSVVKDVTKDLVVEQKAIVVPAPVIDPRILALSRGETVDPRGQALAKETVVLTAEQKAIAHILSLNAQALALEQTPDGRQRAEAIREEARRKQLAIDAAARVRRRGS